MSLIAKDTSNGQDFAPIPSGLQHGVCYAVIDIGTQPQFGNYPSRRKVVFCWEIPGERIELERDGKKVSMPRAISEKFTLSLASKGNLRPMLESWRGRPFTAEELEGFDVGNVIGANCFLNVVHAQGKGEKAGRTYANVASVNPLPKGMAKVKPENPTLVFSMDDFKGPVMIPPEIPEWIEGLIKQSEEYNMKLRASNAPAQVAPNGTSDHVDEDVPF
jgi:hypothetical protein